MIRNYYPESVMKMVGEPESMNMKDQIIFTATKLFIEKGFDKTSINDIANALDMSKGGIYHHFQSKSEIIEAVKIMKSESIADTIKGWANISNKKTAREKLIFILERNLSDQEANNQNEAFSAYIKSTDFIVSTMKDAIQISAPVFAEVMHEGVKDGSIQTDYPDECAEVFMLLINIWCDPVIFEADEEKISKRLKFLQQMMKSLGVDIVSDHLLQETKLLLENLYSNGGKQNE